MKEDLVQTPRVPPVIARTVAIYKAVALISFNVLVVYLLFNLALAGAFRFMGIWREGAAGRDPVSAQYGQEALDKVYPGLDRAERELLLRENWARPVVYADYTHFKERPIAGKYVNVSEAGYRHSANQGPWPPSADNVNVFVFGGSTTFGFGLADDQTVPSRLQEALATKTARRVCVYNFGVGFYYSTQERLRFERLLQEGYVPDVAVFIDGINDGFRIDNRPEFSQRMAESLNLVSGGSSWWEGLAEVGFRQLPIGYVASWAAKKANPLDRSTEALIRGCETYFFNKALIEQAAARYGVTPVFVWQPAPGYKYDKTHHLFVPRADFFEYQRVFYEAMHKYLETHEPGENFLWCADLQEQRAEPLYCDQNHYTAAFANDFALAVCQLGSERKLFDKAVAK